MAETEYSPPIDGFYGPGRIDGPVAMFVEPLPGDTDEAIGINAFGALSGQHATDVVLGTVDGRSVKVSQASARALASELFALMADVGGIDPTTHSVTGLLARRGETTLGDIAASTGQRLGRAMAKVEALKGLSIVNVDSSGPLKRLSLNLNQLSRLASLTEEAETT